MGYLELLYLRARWYEPGTGTFLSKDAWPGDTYRSQSQNRWSYVQGNPILFTDPSGYCNKGLGAANVTMEMTPCDFAGDAGAVAIVTVGTGVAIIVGGVIIVTLEAVNEEINQRIAQFKVFAKDPAKTKEDLIAYARKLFPTSDPKPKGTPVPIPIPTPPPLPEETCEPELPEKHISLGFNREGSDFDGRPLLKPFTDSLNKKWNPKAYVYSFGNWKNNNVINVPIRPFHVAFGAAMAGVRSDKIKQIHFNLEGIKAIDSVNLTSPYIDFAENFSSKGDINKSERIFPNPPPPYITADELYIIKNDAILCSKTTFYENGSTTLTPFTGLICGQ